jgi:hypothetical protein
MSPTGLTMGVVRGERDLCVSCQEDGRKVDGEVDMSHLDGGGTWRSACGATRLSGTAAFSSMFIYSPLMRLMAVPAQLWCAVT